MKYKIDVVRIRENYITLNGWVIGRDPASGVKYSVLDEKKQPMEFRIVPTRRDDVSQIYFKKVIDKDFGFDIRFPYERGKNYWLVIRCEGHTARIKYNEELIAKRASVAHKRMEKIRDLCNMETVRVAWEYFQKHGLKALFLKSKNKLEGIDSDYEYAEWYEKTKPAAEELARQRKESAEWTGDGPLFSIVIPVYQTPEKYLRELLDSLLNQTYRSWRSASRTEAPRERTGGRSLRSTRTRTAASASGSSGRILASREIRMRRSRWPRGISSRSVTTMTCFRRMRSMSARGRSARIRAVTASTATRTSSTWTAARSLTRTSSRTLIRTS